MTASEDAIAKAGSRNRSGPPMPDRPGTNLDPSASVQALATMRAIRQALRQRRIAAGISQADLARRLGISRETLVRRESTAVLDIRLVDLLVWIVALGGETGVTFNVTPAESTTTETEGTT